MNWKGGGDLLNDGSVQVDTKHKLAYSIEEVVEVTGLGRSFLYEILASGQLTARRVGVRRTVILKDDLDNWLKSLPALYPSKPGT